MSDSQGSAAGETSRPTAATQPDHVWFRLATSADAAALSGFGARVFEEAFGGDNRPEDMTAYLRTAFTPERQAEEIADPHGFIILAMARGSAVETNLIGYAHVLESVPPVEIEDTDALEVKRFYIASEWRGRGVAQQLMGHVLRLVAERGARTLWLGVWERNERAIAFYMKFGFQRAGSHVFLLGTDAQTDLVMVRKPTR
jgi:ribosomal protein S18 acetylase RimI-like enzyme